MTQCKSIRKDDVNVTATQLGVKVGDKFVVLSPKESYNRETYNQDYSFVGDIVELLEDDNTDIPYFRSLSTGSSFHEYLACLTRYEEKQEQEESAVNNNISLYIAEYSSAEYAQDNIGDGDCTSYAVFKIKGLTPKQYSDILAFINNMK